MLYIVVLFSIALHAAEFNGERALAYTGKAVKLGPRTPGSAVSRQFQRLVLAELKPLGCEILPGRFTAATPAGPVTMRNLIARFKGSSGRAVVFSGHYDTKSIAGVAFAGANDGGASAGFLLEMARALAGRSLKDDVYLVWFDGEEAYGQWSPSDSLYGSRELARAWQASGMTARIKALINVDMIGDRDLGILQEMYSTSWLRKLVWDTAAETGYGKYFLATGGSVEDDHAPFLNAGVPALDLIDFDYGPGNSYWHTAKDNIDKVSAHSLGVVGNVLLTVLKRLEALP